MQAPRHLKMCLKGVTMCPEWKNNVAEQPLCSPALSREWVECTPLESSCGQRGERRGGLLTQPTSFKVSSPGFPSFAGRTCNVLESSAISRERGRGAQHGTGITHSRSPTCPDQIVGWSQTTVTNAAFDSKKEKQIEGALENAHQGITRLAGRRNTQNSLHPCNFLKHR